MHGVPSRKKSNPRANYAVGVLQERCAELQFAVKM